MGGWVDLVMGRYISFLLFIGLVWGQSDKPLSVNSLSWLTGSWQGPIEGNILEETWLPPRAGTIVALVRLTNESSTKFVEIIHIEEVNGTLELQLQLFDNSLSPENPEAYHFELTKMEENYISFKGISPGAHRTLSYERPEKDIFYIRFQPHEGEAMEIRLTPVKY
ncbi:MAG: DUF6265 family protein [Candidatus Marinimicrobia bacterium]|nr:DUF6265 family protein [Candidatus Neomarinimicrobiota bacterium]